EVCLAQLFLQSGSAYNCVSELGELGLVEFRDLNPSVNAFQRKYVGEVRRCEEMEKTFTFLEQEIRRSLSPPLSGPLPLPGPAPPAPQAREALQIQEESERLAQELREVSRNRDSLRSQLASLTQYKRVLQQTHSLTGSLTQVSLSPVESGAEHRQDVRLSFIAGVIHPWKVPAFERLLWRACRGYIIVNFREMEEPVEVPETGEMVQWTVFLISYWGDQIGQKVKKICDCYHTNIFAYPESANERQEILEGLEKRIEEIISVLSQTEHFLQQVLSKAVASLPQWMVQIRKSKAVYLVLNMCSVSVTEKCLIAEVWCPVTELHRLNTALREGSSKSGSGVDSFYNRIPSSDVPPTLFRTNSFTAGFQTIVDAYGVASYREVNPALYTIITFPFLFAVMFGDVGHGILMTVFALWMVLEEKDPKLRRSTNEVCALCVCEGGVRSGLYQSVPESVRQRVSQCISLSPSQCDSGSLSVTVCPRVSATVGSLSVTVCPRVSATVGLSVYQSVPESIWSLSNNHLNFLNSYKMKMSVIIGIIHMTFGVCLSVCNYRHFQEISSIFLVFLPEVVFMLCLFGYLVFMILFKWVVYGPGQSRTAPSILIHFIDMFLFSSSKDNAELYTGQVLSAHLSVCLSVSVPW
uniref:V-type proton ATPase subunit a n=1 Tax=Lepisosteus oculatus TaxID=7918 RepID=W5MHE3_LEPOC